MKERLHLGKARLAVRAVLIEHLRLLGDGVHRRAAGDEADVVGGLAVAVLGRLHGVERVDHGGQIPDGVAVSKGVEGVAALGLHHHPVAVGAHGAADHGVELHAVQGDECPEAITVPGGHGAAALQISQALLAGIGHKDQLGLGLQMILEKIPCAEQKHRQVGRVVADAGAEVFAALLPEGHGRQIRKDRVGVRHKDHHVSIVAAQGADDIFGLVDLRAAAGLFQPVSDIGRPGVLLMRRRGNGAEIANQDFELVLAVAEIVLHGFGEIHCGSSC